MLRPPSGPADEDAAFNERQDVAQGRVLRALRELGVSRCGEPTLVAVEQAVENKCLALVESGSLHALPEARLGEDRAENCLGAVNRSPEAAQKPIHPRRGVHRCLLRPLEDVVVGRPLLPDLRRHAVEALGAVLGTRQRHVGDGAGNTAIAIVKRMDGHKPQVAQPGLQHLVDISGPVEPVQEGGHLPFEARRGGCCEMDALLADGSGDNLHRASAVVPPGPCPDLPQAAAPRRKQGRVPREEPFGCEWLTVVAGGVEDHLDDSLDVPVRRLQRADVHAEPAGDRRSHLVGFELFPLDLTALEDVGGQRPQDGFLPEFEAQRFHAADQPALPVAHRGQRLGQPLRVPAKSRPVPALVDVHSPLLLRTL